ncbi:MAG: PQQ-like beta-propeller repeat protein, partial [Solirubrobacterales bacterium]|nr:PQQ-like beta-propeller repeat protein [Solirubrobacterales bacterium]
HWTRSSWQSLDSGDVDLGSSEPVLVPNGVVFQIGKQGVGYLLSGSHLGGTGESPAYQASVCSGSWGGAIYDNGIIYVSCSTGLRALALNAGAPSFSAVGAWHVNSAINGPPIVAGGLVWATDWNSGTLYGLDPQTGQTVVKQATPAMDHFATPSASDGKLFLATGPAVEAYTIATPSSPAGPGTGPSSKAPTRAKCSLKLRSRRVQLHHPKRHKHQRHAPPSYATVALTANCSQAVQVKLGGVVSEHLSTKGKSQATSRAFHLATVRAALSPNAKRTLPIRLTPALLRALGRHVHESGKFTLTTTTVAGTTRVSTHGVLKL